jgi:hypothetical protein
MIYLTLALWPWVLGALAAGMVIGWYSGRGGDTT